MINCIAVGLGGFFGAVCRYLIGLIPLREVTLFPVKTFCINLLGCVLIAVLLAAARDTGLPPKAELFLKVGVCGGFTTFSTFASETAVLIQQGYIGVAAAYALLSVVLGVGIVLGIQILTLT